MLANYTLNLAVYCDLFCSFLSHIQEKKLDSRNPPKKAKTDG